MTANDLALGRNHTTADSVSTTEFWGSDPCVRVDITWDDGAHVYMIHDTMAEAMEHVHGLGFFFSD